MTIVILLIAALVLMATMLFLTIGVNELEKKSMELVGLLSKRYTIKAVPKLGKAPAPAAAPGNIEIPPLGRGKA